MLPDTPVRAQGAFQPLYFRWKGGLARIIRIIKDDEVLEETENLQLIYEKLIIYDKEVKEVVISVAKYKYE